MRGNNILGLIFANMSKNSIREIARSRTMGSIPFGGRYRLIDFPLSNMANSGINKVGVVVNGNYRSLLNHIGSGKPWDLSRRNDGLFILPPISGNAEDFDNKVKAIFAIREFINDSKEEYVLLCDCDTVCNINYADILKRHIENNADITIVYKNGTLPQKIIKPVVISEKNEDKISNIIINPEIDYECDYGLNMYLINKGILSNVIEECMSRNEVDFERDFIQKNIKRFNIYGYKFEGFSSMITSSDAYFESNMAMMKEDVRIELFDYSRPIYTKVRDDMPARYGSESNVKNSLISNGCIVEGEVYNSILFKGVHIKRGAKVSNCIIMQDTEIGEHCRLDYAMIDKNTIIRSGRSMMGFASYPIYIGKSSVV